MPQNPKSKDNLVDRSAPDSPSDEGELVMLNGAVPKWMKERIKKMPGSQGYHLRRAIRLYLQSIDEGAGTD
jgi:hypothetical protein